MEYILTTLLPWIVFFYFPGVLIIFLFAKEKGNSWLLFTVVSSFLSLLISIGYNPVFSTKFLPEILATVGFSGLIATLITVVIEEMMGVEARGMKSIFVRVTVSSGFLVVAVFLLFVSFSGFHAEQVKSLLKIEESKVLSTTKPEKVRLVPKATAVAVADKVLGSYKTEEGLVLGSLVEVDVAHTTVQKINNTLYWVVPLKYTGMFKQFKLGPIPGFIVVDAYDTNKPPRFLQRNPVTGREYRLNCSMGGYFARNAHRILRATHLSKRLIDFSFEVSDEWEPYIVATVVEPSIWFDGPYRVKGVATLNLETCKVRDFAIGEIPEWIDRVVPEKVAVDTLNTIGKWSHGLFSGIFTRAYNWEVTNGGMTFVQDGSGRTFWVSAITSTGSDQSAVGIVAVDTRTMATVKQSLTGPTEDGVAARVTASLGVNSEVWAVSKPLLYRIYDRLVWVAVVIDKKTFLPTRYAIVDAGDVRKIEIDDDFFRAVERFFTGTVALELVKEVVSWSGSVVRSTVTAGIAYILDATGRTWKCMVEEHVNCVFTRAGDEVSMKGMVLREGVYKVNEFRNMTLEGMFGKSDGRPAQ